jgi:predicted dehydrogenase
MTNTHSNDPSAERSFKWGILGAARIARKLIPAMREAGTEVAAVGASTLGRAQELAREMDIPLAVEGYQAVIDNSEIDAVYIPLANHLHSRWALACARAGKPCLCEKPLVLTADEARQLREAFAESGARLVEGFMWRHNPQTQWILHQLREGEIGNLLRIDADFSFSLNRPDDFRWRDEYGGGALWDIGVYCINAMRLFFGEEPRTVSTCVALAQGAKQADASAAGWLDFGGGRLGVFHCSFVSVWRQSLSLIGTRGMIEVERPFIGTIERPSVCRLTNGDGMREQHFPPSDSFLHMIAHFRRAVGDASFALMPAEDGVAQALVMESLASSGLNGGRPVSLNTL